MECEVCSPDSSGMRVGRLSLLDAVLREEQAAGAFPGAVCRVSRGGRVVYSGCAGSLSPDRPEPAAPDTIFDMASVTKPMTAALMCLMLAERGRLSLWQGVKEFFPDRSLPHLEGVTLRHLITHTSGLPAWVDLYSSTTTREQAIDMLLSVPRGARPGERYEYSCLGFILLGLICEKVAGEAIHDFLTREVWAPLGMTSTGYNPDGSLHGRIASTRNCPARQRELVGEVHDGNAWRLGGISGNAGLFSTADDVMTFCHALLGFGSLEFPLSRLARLRYMTSQIRPEVGSQSYGWFCYGSDMLPAGDLLPSDTFGHTGFTGTAVLMSPSEELVIILLTNRVCTDSDGSLIRRARRRVANIVAGSII